MKHLLIFILTVGTAYAHKPCRIYPKMNYREIKVFAGKKAAKSRVITCKDMLDAHLWRKDSGIRSYMQIKEFHLEHEALEQMKVRL